jgi:hypothetical protein
MERERKKKEAGEKASKKKKRTKTSECFFFVVDFLSSLLAVFGQNTSDRKPKAFASLPLSLARLSLRPALDPSRS